MGLGHSPVLDTTSLQLLLDSANSKSYGGSGTTWTDLSENARNFTLVNGPYENYGFGGSIYFDGVDDYASSSYAPVFTGDFTIQCWVNFKTYINYQNIISSANNSGANYGFWIEFGSARGFVLANGLTGTGSLILEDNIVNLTTLATNTWHYVCVTRSGSGANNLKVYVNNVLCGQSTYTSNIGIATQTLFIAKYDQVTTTNYFNGYISNIVIQHSAITDEVRLKNYAALRGRFDNFYNIPLIANGLVLNLDAGNPSSYSGSGTTWIDLIDQANNGTLINGVGFSTSNGGSLTFNGSNQRVSTNFKPSGARSYFIWIKYNTISSLPNGYSLTGTQQVNAYNYLGISNGGYFYYYAGTTGNQLNNVLLNANTWYQQGFVLNADGSRTLYLNGIAVGSEAGGVGGTATSEFSIGCVNQNHWVNGSIPVVTQYNRALTASEVVHNYNALRGRFGV